MDAYKLTTKSQEALSNAVHGAATAGHPHVEPVHLLLALLDQPDGSAAPLLDAVDADRAAVYAEAQQLMARLPSATGRTVAMPGTSRPTMLVLNAASQTARDMGDEYVATEHLVVGLAKEGGQVAEMLRRAGATPEVLLEGFAKVRGSARVTTPDPEATYQSLEKYGVDLTAAARDGKLDPVIGRDGEIRRVVQVLSRRTKN